MKTFIGTIATVLTVVTLFPQIAKIVKTKHTKDISLLTYVILASAAALWVVYGFIISDRAISITNSIVVASSLTVIVYKLKYG